VTAAHKKVAEKPPEVHIKNYPQEVIDDNASNNNNNNKVRRRLISK
jgi:hypothetical protein